MLSNGSAAEPMSDAPCAWRAPLLRPSGHPTDSARLVDKQATGKYPCAKWAMLRQNSKLPTAPLVAMRITPPSSRRPNHQTTGRPNETGSRIACRRHAKIRNPEIMIISPIADSARHAPRFAGRWPQIRDFGTVASSICVRRSSPDSSPCRSATRAIWPNGIRHAGQRNRRAVFA